MNLNSKTTCNYQIFLKICITKDIKLIRCTSWSSHYGKQHLLLYKIKKTKIQSKGLHIASIEDN